MAKYLINSLNRKSKINKEIYGNFSEHLGRCIYDGVWVGKDSPIPNTNGVRTDVIEALRKIKLPVLRWPGGCFADTYHWKDAVGPQEQRKKIVNRIWGDLAEDNSFGTNEFMDMCEAIGCEAYIGGNLGTGTIQEMADWVEYITGNGPTEMAELRRKNGREKPWKLKYFGIGNEVWGGGGDMTAEYYANLYRHFHHFVVANGFMTESKMLCVASGPSSNDYEFTDKVTSILYKPTFPMQQVSDAPLMDGLSLHHYAFAGDNYRDLKTARDFNEDDWYKLLYNGAVIEEMIVKHDTIMSKYDPDKRIGLMVDEWGSWYRAEEDTDPRLLYQQNTMRDAVLAAIYLNIFNKHSDRVKLATCAQLVNVLQSVILTQGDKMILTPTYHVFDLFKEHMDATLLDSYIQTTKIGTPGQEIDSLYESSSVDAEGRIIVTLCNTSIDADETIDATVYGSKLRSVRGELLHQDPHAYNDFDHPNTVALCTSNATLTESGFCCSLPAGSVVRLILETE